MEPNFSFPLADLQAGQTTPLIRLRKKYYGQDCPRSVSSSIVFDFPMLSGSFSSFLVNLLVFFDGLSIILGAFDAPRFCRSFYDF